MSKRPQSEFIKTLIMEIRSLKLTFNMASDYVVQAVYERVMKQINLAEAKDTASLAKAVQQTLKDYSGLIQEFTNEGDDKCLLEEAEIFCSKNEAFKDQFHIILQSMYKLEILKDSSIIHWGE